MTGLLAFYSFSVLPLAQVYSILFAMPLLITVLAIPILGEKVGFHRWIAVIIGLVGVLIVLRPDDVQLGIGHLISFLIAVLGLIATLFVIASYREGEAAIVAPMQYSQIIWASIFGYFLFDEQINSSIIVGTTIIILSGLYIVIRESGSNSENTPVLRTRSRELGSGLRVGAMLRAIRRR